MTQLNRQPMPEAGCDGDGCKQDLQKECVDRDGFSLQAFGDDVSAGAVVELAAGEKRHGKQDDCDDCRAGNRSSGDFPRQRGDLAKCDDKEHAYQRAENGQREGGHSHRQGEGLYGGECPGMFLNAHHS